ncbi:MAG: NAD+ synthase [Chlamydiae bacterium]|nr:NAD+ synthase [Chlamydiota bacterium]
MKVLLAQLNPTIGDLEGNTKKVLHSMEIAREKGVDLIVFPEMTLCGYTPEDLLFSQRFIDDMEECLDQIVRASKGVALLVGMIRRNPMREEKLLYNSAAVISDGMLLGFYDKILLPHYDVFNERRYFSEGRSVQVWNIKGVRVAVVICEDMWQNASHVSNTTYVRDPVKELVSYRPDILCNLTASPFQAQKGEVRVEVCRAAAKTLNCPVVYSCQVGANGMLIFDGYSMVVDKDGTLLALAKGFEEDFMTVDIPSKGVPAKFEPDVKKDVYRALCLGVSDYFAKANQKKAVIGLSGGIDSALVASIAKDALGKENVLGIYMPSRFSSKEGYEDAKKLAENLGIEFKTISIEPMFELYLETLKEHFPDEDFDITEENLQARIRGVMLMAFANKMKMLLLNTGDKSEFALGYCTLYGDMCGALSVIGDVLKTDVYELCKYVNREREIIPQRIFDKPPSPELRHHHKATDTLPPYPIVDVVLKAYIEAQQPIDVIAKQYNIDYNIVYSIIERIYKAEHKMRQAPPALRVSGRALTIGRRKPLHHTGRHTVY